MPTIAKIFGMTILMHWSEFELPHIHVWCDGYDSQVFFTGDIVGKLSKANRQRIGQWVKAHQKELVEAWNDCRDTRPPKWID